MSIYSFIVITFELHLILKKKENYEQSTIN